MDFLDNLDFLLKSNNMKRVDLARALNIAPSTINSWYARGSDHVNIKVLKDIAAYFGVSLEFLINGNTLTSVSFDDKEYTKEELELIAKFGRLLKESRAKDD